MAISESNKTVQPILLSYTVSCIKVSFCCVAQTASACLFCRFSREKRGLGEEPSAKGFPPPRPYLSSIKLRAVQRVIEPLRRHQLVVRALLNNPAVADNENHIRVLDR